MDRWLNLEPSIMLTTGSMELSLLEEVDMIDYVGHVKYAAGFDKVVQAVAQWVSMVAPRSKL
jgi:hypothetical protein